MDKLKKDLVDEIERYKERSRINNNRLFMLEAAILRGVYSSIGGKKAIVLPYYCSFLTSMVVGLANAKSKIDNSNLNLSTRKLFYEMSRHAKIVKNIDYQSLDNKSIMRVYNTVTSYEMNYDITNGISDAILADMLVYLLMTGNAGYTSSEFYGIREFTEKALALID